MPWLPRVPGADAPDHLCAGTSACGLDRAQYARPTPPGVSRLEARPMNILAISGSLQSQSSNSALVRHTAAHCGNGLEVHVFDQLAELPHFNPELDGEDPPAAVRTLRAMAGTADAVLIASPEYAHEMPGSLNPIESMISIARKVTGNV